MAAWFLVYFQALNNYPAVVRYLFEYGSLLGEAALILYCITLVPGIITRLQWFPTLTRPIGSIIMLFRRHFGILMFITAFWHMTFTTYIPYYAMYNFNPPGLPTLATYQMMGMIAWLLLFPLWLTSNDFSQKKLGKYWKILHKLTYLSMMFIFVHVALQEASWMYVIGTFIVLEVISWILAWRRKTLSPPIVATAPIVKPETISIENNTTTHPQEV
jgi:sulfoxide reductase heme-binding subunit YedZ